MAQLHLHLPRPGTTLCLACSSSLPPRRTDSSNSAKASNSPEAFITSCCNRPICPACITANPRLARYNPCLHCLGGVAVVGRSSSTASRNLGQTAHNLDGGVRDEDVFAVGEDEDEEIENTHGQGGPLTRSSSDSPPPPYIAASHPDEVEEISPSLASNKRHSEGQDSACTESSTRVAHKHYIEPNDTLLGIALKYRVDGRLLCRINNIPFSTLRTTPHLLHTRTVLELPASATVSTRAGINSNSYESPEYIARRAREKAAKRLQNITKETDWRIAKTYVELASDPAFQDPEAEFNRKEGNCKDDTQPLASGSSRAPEVVAISQYLDDEEWERNERRMGRGVSLSRFPLFDPMHTMNGLGSGIGRFFSRPS